VEPTPPDLLALAASPRYEDRCTAAERLAAYDDDVAHEALLRLLTDEADTGPVQTAALALIERGDESGVRLIFRAMALGDDDVADHLVFFVGEATPAFWDCALRSATSDHVAERVGAVDLLRSVGAPGFAPGSSPAGKALREHLRGRFAGHPVGFRDWTLGPILERVPLFGVHVVGRGSGWTYVTTGCWDAVHTADGDGLEFIVEVPDADDDRCVERLTQLAYDHAGGQPVAADASIDPCTFEHGRIVFARVSVA
jgi:hypothetical protein